MLNPLRGIYSCRNRDKSIVESYIVLNSKENLTGGRRH